MLPIELIFPDGKSKKFLLPTAFEQLTQEQYLKTIALMKRSEKEPSAQWLLVTYLLKMTISDLKLLNAVQRVELLGQLDFLFDMERLPHKAMIKKISCSQGRKGLMSLHGPGDTIKNLSFAEFMMAETKLERFEKSNDQKDLNELCGVLFRPGSKESKNYSDKRAPYEEGLVEYHGKFFESIDPDVKAAIMMNYFGATGFLPKMYPNLFPAKIQPDPKEVKKAEPPKKSVSLSWINMLFRMADWDQIKIAATEKTKLHTVLWGFNDMLQVNKK